MVYQLVNNPTVIPINCPRLPSHVLGGRLGTVPSMNSGTNPSPKLGPSDLQSVLASSKSSDSGNLSSDRILRALEDRAGSYSAQYNLIESALHSDTAFDARNIMGHGPRFRSAFLGSERQF